ncbi:PREDICTED: synaptotagmin-like protein 3 [Condylura cristata]|uniref:synaptotagmin-like protein 3 n=1 Tax=Condylura cristata TaxID=143302 RepID=UPI0006429D9E|nr:PREDICTED: synaptotagmin-like protein 3 [Condylura cristata]
MAQEATLNNLQERECEAILQVLYRDRAVRSVEEERIRRLKAHLQHLRWRGAKTAGRECQERSCARCRRALGPLLNRGAVCQGCSHRVCPQCRVFLHRTGAWKCTVCFEDRNVKIKSGEWFFEERAKKFPTEGEHETAGAKLLKSYQKLSSISVVPPTPPPLSESQCSGCPGSRLQELGQFKGFNKSMENLFLCVTTHMKKLSKSQNDMTSDKQLQAAGSGRGADRTDRRSQSDTAVNVSSRKVSVPAVLQPVNPGSPKRSTSPVLKPEDLSSSPVPNALFSGGLRHAENGIKKTLMRLPPSPRLPARAHLSCLLCRYVKTYLLPDRSSQGKRKTRVQKSTVDPAFQETLKYQVELAQLATRRLQVSVWHLGTLARKAFLGEVTVPLAAWDFEDSQTRSFCWYPLRAKAEKGEDSVFPTSNGELAVRAKLVIPEGPRKPQEAQEGTGQPSNNGQLCLVVLGARNLPVRSDGTLNSFVKGCLTLPNQHKLRLKSPVLKRQGSPQWKHSFVFSGVSTAQLRQASLELTVWDQAMFGLGDRLLGGARLGTKEDPAVSTNSCPQAKLQWQKVLSSPNLWTDMTLVLH